jgi:uncharacterized protein (DUF1778 family)
MVTDFSYRYNLWMAKRGRPTLDPSERRNLFPIRLNEEEKAAVEKAAAAVGEKPSSWARRVLLAAAKRILGR